MKTQKVLLIWIGLISGISIMARGQGAFQNLGFESANLAPISSGQLGGSVPISDALPGWAGFIGSTQVSTILQNDYTFGDPSIDILGPNWSYGGIIEGQYTLVLQPGGPGGVFSASVSQTGLVPINTQSLQFKAETYSDFSVSLGGQDLSLITLGTGANYTLYDEQIYLSLADRLKP